jgi:hypothetical protein
MCFHVRASLGISLNEFIERIDGPVALVDDDTVVLTTNSRVQTILGKDLKQMKGFKGGTVFECKNSYLAAGCGKTEHCISCTLRNTITETLRTGTSHVKSKAFLNNKDGSTINLRISAEKVDEVVLLRIDEIEKLVAELQAV